MQETSDKSYQMEHLQSIQQKNSRDIPIQTWLIKSTKLPEKIILC